MDAIVVWIEGQALGGIGGGSTADLAVRGIAWIRVVVGQGPGPRLSTVFRVVGDN